MTARHSTECDGPDCAYEACMCWCHTEVEFWANVARLGARGTDLSTKER